jgi:hypothetical protein
MTSLISASEVDEWAKANPRRAQEILPELIIRLILSTSNKIEDFNLWVTGLNPRAFSL